MTKIAESLKAVAPENVASAGAPAPPGAPLAPLPAERLPLRAGSPEAALAALAAVREELDLEIGRGVAGHRGQVGVRDLANAARTADRAIASPAVLRAVHPGDHGDAEPASAAGAAGAAAVAARRSDDGGIDARRDRDKPGIGGRRGAKDIVVHRDERRAAFAAEAARSRRRRRRRVGAARAGAAIAAGRRGEDAVETGLERKIGVAVGRE